MPLKSGGATVAPTAAPTPAVPPSEPPAVDFPESPADPLIRFYTIERASVFTFSGLDDAVTLDQILSDNNITLESQTQVSISDSHLVTLTPMEETIQNGFVNNYILTAIDFLGIFNIFQILGSNRSNIKIIYCQTKCNIVIIINCRLVDTCNDITISAAGLVVIKSGQPVCVVCFLLAVAEEVVDSIIVIIGAVPE